MSAKRVAIIAGALALLAVVAYAGVCAYFVVHEQLAVFYPMARASTSPEAAGLKGVAEVTIATEDGERLYGWWTAPAAG
ncbi:MAG TPA: hypothetical protein VGQ90_03780, partial [Stellaceae bacterium]|nr:hypothetical protein [Stellaceae bacterium]